MKADFPDAKICNHGGYQYNCMQLLEELMDNAVLAYMYNHVVDDFPITDKKGLTSKTYHL